MIIRELTYVYAAHAIRRGDHIVVKYGSPGRVLYSRPSWFEKMYTVNSLASEGITGERSR